MVLIIYGHGGHLDVTHLICINFLFLAPISFSYKICFFFNHPTVFEKNKFFFYFEIIVTLGQSQRMTLTIDSHIDSFN